MGRTTRWFKGLFGLKKEKEERENSSNTVNQRENKRRWSFTRTVKDSKNVGQISDTIPVSIPAVEAAWLRSFYGEINENEQNKHAIAVAAATAAAADAAVAAAQAAVAVVRLTSHGRGTMFYGGREKSAVKIQTVFRGFLARKALRALKGLVKLQAVVRGYLVRKQASATLYSMQALIRAQATVRSQRIRSFSHKDHTFQPEISSRKSIERFDDGKSDYTSSIHSRRISSSIETMMNEESPKIVEIDTNYKPKSRSRRTNISMSDICESPNPYQIPSRLSIPDRNYPEFDWGFIGDDYKKKFSTTTAQSTPRFVNSRSNLSVTPSKSVVCETDNYSNYYPNYMANTQSFRAKLRSQSAPKQRPNVVLPSPRKKIISLNEMMESRVSLSSIKMRKSFSQVQDVLNFKNTVMGKLNHGSSEIIREEDRDYLQSRW